MNRNPLKNALAYIFGNSYYPVNCLWTLYHIFRAGQQMPIYIRFVILFTAVFFTAVLIFGVAPRVQAQAVNQQPRTLPVRPNGELSVANAPDYNSVISLAAANVEKRNSPTTPVKKTPPPAAQLENLVSGVQNKVGTAVNSMNAAVNQTGKVNSKPNNTAARNVSRPAQPSMNKFPIFNIGKDFVHELKPSNDRNWSQNHKVLQTAEFNGNMVTVRNVRYSKYAKNIQQNPASATETDEAYTTIYYDAVFNLDEIQTMDLVIVPFQAMPSLAHVQTSFGFADGRHIALSIEARYEEGEKYDPVAAGLRQFELIYVFADERDLIRIGSALNKNDVHLYQLKLTPAEIREVFVDTLNRANALSKKPEFYHPLWNSCVTNLVHHINKSRPNAIPREYRTLLPGLMDEYVYDLKLMVTPAKTFKEAKENAKVNWLIEKYGDLEYFSAGVRQNLY